MKSKPYSKGLLATSIGLAALITISTVLQFGDFYYALSTGACTPEFVTERLEADGGTDATVVAGLRGANSDVAVRVELTPLMLVDLAPLILYLFVCFYDRRTSINSLGKVAASIILLEFVAMASMYVVVTTQHS